MIAMYLLDRLFDLTIQVLPTMKSSKGRIRVTLVYITGWFNKYIYAIVTYFECNIKIYGMYRDQVIIRKQNPYKNVSPWHVSMTVHWFWYCPLNRYLFFIVLTILSLQWSLFFCIITLTLLFGFASCSVRPSLKGRKVV
jgi:hypothetical protein